MVSDLARGCNEQLINSQFGQSMYIQNPGLMALSSETFTRNASMESNQSDGGGSSSSYILACDNSRHNDEIRRPSATEESGVQNSRVPIVQGSTLASSTSMENNGLMYFLTLLLPLVSVNAFDFQWSCTPSAIIRATELPLIQVARFIRQARAYLRHLARDQIARDLFATAMDIVLVIYAIGFLFLSLYQASVFA